MNSTSALYTYGKDLISLARRNQLDPVLYREDVIERVIHILLRRTKNNPVLIGKPGVGKTAIVEGLANRIVSGAVPSHLQKIQIISLDVGSIVAGAKYRGAFEERMKQIIDDVKAQAGNIIIFIDEIHTLIGAGKVEGGLDAANMLKPMLARGEFCCIGATTDDDYREYIEKDAALERRLSPVWVEEPTVEQATSMIRGLKEKYELHHKLRINDDAIQAATRLAHRYINDRFLPDSAIDLVDEAAAMKQSYLSSKPVELRKLEERVFLLKLELQMREEQRIRLELQSNLDILESELIDLQNKWQEERDLSSELHSKKEQLEQYKSEEVAAVREGNLNRAGELKHSIMPLLEKQIHDIERRGSAKLDSVTAEDVAQVITSTTNIPVQKLLETDKLRLINIEHALSSRVVGQSSAISAVASAIRRSRAGLSDINRPLGCFLFLGPTGVGKTELSRALADLLFDREESLFRIDMSEFSQEHSVARLIGAPPGYIGYGKGGVLTESVRRRPYQIVLCDEIEKAHPNIHNLFLQIMDAGRLTDGNGRIINFKQTMIIMTSNIGAQFSGDSPEHREEEIKNTLVDNFTPEFINRLDGIITFNTLSIDHIKQMIPQHIKRLEIALEKNWNVKVRLTIEAMEWLAQNGYSNTYGARPLRRLFEQSITNPISYMLFSGQIIRGASIIVSCEANNIVITTLKELEA